MKSQFSQWNQYPNAYSKKNSSYTYFMDDGSAVTLTAGKDGVTEEWIAQLKAAHIEEMNMLRRGRSKGEGKNLLLSLTQFEEEAEDKCDVLIDPNADVEGNYIAGIERAERREAIRKAFASLTPEQQELLINVKVHHMPLKDIATSLNIQYQSVQSRLETARKNFLEKLLGAALYLAILGAGI